MRLAARAVLAMGIVCWGSPQLARALTPEVNFQLQCMGCHQRDGAGQPGRVPSFRRTLVPMSYLPQGREFLIRVPGVAQAPLSDEDIAALLNWMVRSMSDVRIKPGFKDYSTEEIHRQRARPIAHVSAARTQVLRRLGASVRPPKRCFTDGSAAGSGPLNRDATADRCSSEAANTRE